MLYAVGTMREWSSVNDEDGDVFVFGVIDVSVVVVIFHAVVVVGTLDVDDNVISLIWE